jgi:hypothetical protein
MCLKICALSLVLLSATGLFARSNYVVPTTTLAAQTANNTSAANGFTSQSNGNAGAGNVSKVDVHSLLYSGATTKVYAHLLLWFGQSNHMNVGYSSNSAAQIHLQIMDMISRGIDGVIIDWYGPNNYIDDATKLVMAEAETHPGFTFAIMVDQGAIQWDSCTGCTPQQALINQLQYIEQTYVPSPAYMTEQGRPVVTNFNIDLSYTIDWTAVNGALSAQPFFIFQNNNGFSHVLSAGSYSWVMPTTTDYGMSYLTSFYQSGAAAPSEQTVGASYKGFNDSLASWGSDRIMSQQCGQTWLETFSEVNGLYNSGDQLPALQLVTWNDYEEATEIESGINNCLSLSAKASDSTLQWSLNGNPGTVDHYVAYISSDGQNLMVLDNVSSSQTSLNLCSYSVPNGNYILYVQAAGKPSMQNQMSGPVNFTAACAGTATTNPSVTFGTSPSAVTLSAGGSGSLTVTATPQAGAFNNSIALDCEGLPADLTCAFSPAAITPGSNSASSVLTISSSSVASRNRLKPGRGPILAIWFLGLGSFGFVFLGQAHGRRLLSLVLACVLGAALLGSVACGGNGSAAHAQSNGTPTSYTVTVNGSSSAVQLSTTVTVTVQ